jgi:quinol-cytochrome oxidoreductase complex cytochrome b subunit
MNTPVTPTKSRKSFLDLLAHLHPPTIPEETLRFQLSFGLGGMSVVLLFLLVCSGILQLFMYEPTVTGAYSSLLAMYSEVTFGGWIRNIHHWSSNLLVIVAWFHLLRVYFTGATSKGRRLNWIIGHGMFCLILFANFSGYLLPWDQLGYWAVTICTNMMDYFPVIGSSLMELFRGGSEVGPATLAYFYGVHISIIPSSMFVLMLYHFWLIRKSKGLIKKETDALLIHRLPAVPDLIIREAATGLTLVAVVLVVAAIFNAPLHGPANPGMSPNPAKAPWYFLGFQELLLHLHPLFAICVLPVLVFFFVLLFPLFSGTALPPGRWFGGKRGKCLALGSFLAGIISSFGLVLFDENVLRKANDIPHAVDIVNRGYLPVGLYVLAMVCFYQILLRGFKFSRAESLMGAIVFSSAVLVTLTVVGIWLRGPGMQLIW